MRAIAVLPLLALAACHSQPPTNAQDTIPADQNGSRMITVSNTAGISAGGGTDAMTGGTTGSGLGTGGAGQQGQSGTGGSQGAGTAPGTQGQSTGSAPSGSTGAGGAGGAGAAGSGSSGGG